MLNVKEAETLRAAIREAHGSIVPDVDDAILQLTTTAKRSKWCPVCHVSHPATDFAYDVASLDKRADICKVAMRRRNRKLNKATGILTRAEQVVIIRNMAGVDEVGDIARACRLAPATVYEIAHQNRISLARIYHKWDAEDYDLIAALRAEGLTWQQIGDKYEVTKQKAAAWYHSKRRELTGKRKQANI